MYQKQRHEQFYSNFTFLVGNQLWTKNVLIGLEKKNAVAVVRVRIEIGYYRIQGQPCGNEL